MTFFIFQGGGWKAVNTKTCQGERGALAALVLPSFTVDDVREFVAPLLAEHDGPVFTMDDMDFRYEKGEVKLMLPVFPGFEGAAKR